MTATTVTLLNASYEPHAKVTFKHAVKMLFRGVATVEEALDDRMIGPHPWPQVIRLVKYVHQKWKHRPAAWSKRSVFIRDRHTCAYCGGHADTLDHVFPESRGGLWEYTNVVAACERCNHRKGNRTPAEAGMRLRFEPFHPTKAHLEALAATA